MSDDPRYLDEDGDASRKRPQPLAPSARKKWYWLAILLSAPVGLCLLCCGGPVAYFTFGVEETKDPAQIRAALDGISDMQLPPGLEPDSKSHQITGVETVEFRSGSGQSYLIVTTGSRFRLKHMGTLREATDRGRVAGGGRPESPAEEQIIEATVRGQPAEFIYRRYVDTETVSGYFQGKQHPVHLEAELYFPEFAPGESAALVESIR